jgi:hypothetical protein
MLAHRLLPFLPTGRLQQCFAYAVNGKAVSGKLW